MRLNSGEVFYFTTEFLVVPKGIRFAQFTSKNTKLRLQHVTSSNQLKMWQY